jgi:hypothetical protein
MKRGKKLTTSIGAAVFLIALSSVTCAGMGLVHVRSDGTGDCPTIQDAIETVDVGGTVVVEPGIYTGDGNHDIDFLGKGVTVRSIDPADPAVVAATVIDVEGSVDDPRYGVVFDRDGTAAGVLDGVTITNSMPIEPASSGVFCRDSEPVIRRCVISDMHSYSLMQGYHEMGSAVEVKGGHITLEDCTLTRNVGSGDPDTGDWPVIASKSRYTCGGVDILYGRATLERCVLSYNYAWLGGAVFNANLEGDSTVLVDCQFLHNSGHDSGAVYHHTGTLALENCLFANNMSETDGGAIRNLGGLSAINCTLADNDALGSGDALYCDEGGNAEVWNCILWDADDEVVDADGGVSSINYSCVQGGATGEGNISSDPCFVDPTNEDYRLALYSPCVDAANGNVAVETDLLGKGRYDSTFVANTGQGMVRYVDMGAYEFQAPAVHRFWSPVLSRHFYTASEAEKDYVAANSNTWTYEGKAFFAFDAPVAWNVMPVYRFWSSSLSGHFYTMSEDEKDYLIANYPTDVWAYEGIAFYAYPPGVEPKDTAPVYRFWSDRLGSHFYTASESEKDSLINDSAGAWTYEGIAWYAWVWKVHFWPTTL